MVGQLMEYLGERFPTNQVLGMFCMYRCLEVSSSYRKPSIYSLDSKEMS